MAGDKVATQGPLRIIHWERTGTFNTIEILGLNSSNTCSKLTRFGTSLPNHCFHVLDTYSTIRGSKKDSIPEKSTCFKAHFSCNKESKPCRDRLVSKERKICHKS